MLHNFLGQKEWNTRKKKQYEFQERGHQDSGVILLLTLPMLKYIKKILSENISAKTSPEKWISFFDLHIGNCWNSS